MQRYDVIPLITKKHCPIDEAKNKKCQLICVYNHHTLPQNSYCESTIAMVCG